MRYRRFGRTEIQMPVLSCGGMRYQHQWRDVAPDQIPADKQRNVENIIQRALDLGINHIETARGYGTSEMQLGKILPKLDRDRLIVQTKVAPQSSGKKFLQIFETSMRYLGLTHVDLLSLHGINNRELLKWSLQKGGSLEAARQLQKEGRVRHIGFSTHALPKIILETLQTGEFDYVNLHWYFVNPLTWGAVQEAHRRDMGVFIISPNDKGGRLYDPPKSLVELCAPLSPMQFNDLYCLSRPEVHTLSIGASRPTDFDEHVEALKHWDTMEQVVSPIEKRIRERMVEKLGADWCDRWHEGLPDYYSIPGQINVIEILRLWTYAKALDLVGWGKMRYNLLGQADHWFPGEHVAKLDFASAPAWLDKSPFKDRIPDILREAHSLLLDKSVVRLSQAGLRKTLIRWAKRILHRRLLSGP